MTFVAARRAAPADANQSLGARDLAPPRKARGGYEFRLAYCIPSDGDDVDAGTCGIGRCTRSSVPRCVIVGGIARSESEDHRRVYPRLQFAQADDNNREFSQAASKLFPTSHVSRTEKEFRYATQDNRCIGRRFGSIFRVR